MTFFEAVKETGKARRAHWSSRWFELSGEYITYYRKTHISLDSWGLNLVCDDWLPYHEPKPCEACESLKEVSSHFATEGLYSRAIKLLLKNPAVHDEGCGEKLDHIQKETT